MIRDKIDETIAELGSWAETDGAPSTPLDA